MDILFISARYIYQEYNEKLKFEELLMFKNMTFANKLKSFSENGNIIVFVDVWPTQKQHNKELTQFFGQEQNRGDILFYCDGYAVEKLVDNNSETLEHKKYLRDISLGTNWNDMNLLMERIAYFYYKQGKNINNISAEFGDFDLTIFEKKILNILTKNVIDNQSKQHSLCNYQTCKRLPIKILFTDKDGTIFGQSITKEQALNNQLALQEFTDQGNIAVVITSGHGADVFDDFGIGYTNPNLYGMVIGHIASVCINDTGEIISGREYPSLPIATGYRSNKKEAVKLFLEYFLEIGYTFDGIYAIGDSENDLGMLEYVKEIGGVGNLIGKDTSTFREFVKSIKNDTLGTLQCSNNGKKYIKSL